MDNRLEYLKTLKFFAMISFMEGMSYLVLLFLAMPLKYFAGIPVLVKYVGWAHGLFFVLYAFVLLYIFLQYKWKFGRSLLYFIASLLPFAPFWVHKQVAKEMNTLIQEK